MTKILDYIYKKEKKVSNTINALLQENIKNLTILFSIYLLAFSAIIRADYNYADDVMRKYIGYHGWMDWTRWTTTILSNVMHADWDLIDVSPLPQVVACAFLAIASLCLIKIFNKNDRVSLMNIIASLAVGLCPYFLGCISFKYDAPYMALSMMVSIIPFLYRDKNPKIYYIISAFCMLMMFTSYQTSSGIYPTIVVFIAVDMFCNNAKVKKIINFILVSVMAYTSALVFFALVLLQPGNTATIPLNNIFVEVIKRYIYIYSLVSVDFRKLWIFFIIIAVLGYFFCVYLETNNRKGFSVIFAFMAVLLGSVFAWNVLLIMSRDSFDSRNMLGLGPLIAIIFVKLSYSKKSTLLKLCFIIVNWCWLVYAFAYGNALKEQRRYTDFRIQVLINDLNTIDYESDNLKYLKVTGSIGYSPVIENMNNHYDYIRKLLNYNILGESSFIYGEGFYLYNYFDLGELYTYDFDVDYEELNLPLVIENQYETIYADDNFIYVILN